MKEEKKKREWKEPPDDDFLFGKRGKEKEKEVRVARPVSEAGKIIGFPEPRDYRDAVAAIMVALASLAAAALLRGVPLTPGVVRAFEARVAKVTIYRGPQPMTGGRGGFFVNMSQLGVRKQLVRSVREKELGRLGLPAHHQDPGGGPGN